MSIRIGERDYPIETATVILGLDGGGKVKFGHYMGGATAEHKPEVITTETLKQEGVKVVCLVPATFIHVGD